MGWLPVHGGWAVVVLSSYLPHGGLVQSLEPNICERFEILQLNVLIIIMVVVVIVKGWIYVM